jgi:hypothetical protein
LGPKSRRYCFILGKGGGRRGIRTPDQRCVKPLRYHCAIRPPGRKPKVIVSMTVI